MNITIGAFLYGADFLSPEDPLFNRSLAYAVIPYLPAMAETPVLLSLASWEYTGPISVSVMVNPYRNFDEKNYDDNFVVKDLSIYPRYYCKYDLFN